MSGDCQAHRTRRSRAMLARTSFRVSCQRELNAAARRASIPSLLSSYQMMPLPFMRRFTTRRIALSIAPEPSGTPRRR